MKVHQFVVLCSALFACSAGCALFYDDTITSDADNIVVSASTGGDYAIQIKKVQWLSSSPTFFRSNGQTFTLHTNMEVQETTAGNGTDSFGKFQTMTFNYQAGGIRVKDTIKTYPDLPVVIFSQNFPDGANTTRADNVNYVISGFPSFVLKAVKTSTGPLGYMAYGGMMVGDTEKSFGLYNPDDFKITSGLAGGPIALFDGSGDTLVISPASQFMAASNWRTKNVFPSGNNQLAYGIMGGVKVVPPGYTVDFIVYYSSQGVNKAFEGWGSYLRQLYNRTDNFVQQDWTIKYLGYWTDNGAYYYYNKENNKTYEDTILDVKTYGDKLNIPYRYMQYDSWWYYKGVGGGVKTWESRPDIFPDGFSYVYKKVGMVASAHNRYWASDTTYAKQNGGQYNFIVEPEKAVPVDQSFWDDLIANATKNWGLVTYEQDWLNKEFSGMDALLTNITLGATWLNQMASAAVKYNVTVQYCMSNSRHIMQALLNPVVTQARASDDYGPGSDQWKIGVSSIFAYAMGIAPYKDDFWTTTVQPGNPYSHTEPHNEVQTAVSVLSTGPVGPSDMIGHTNATLLMRCCIADGTILKPNKPATAIDDQIYRSALGSAFDGPDGEVWTTYTSISGLTFGIIFVPEIHNRYYMTPEKAGFGQIAESKVFDPHDLKSITDFRSDAPLYISGCNTTSPCMYYVTPVLRGPNLKTTILGELTKFVPVSPQRFTGIKVGGDVTVYVRGAPNEKAYISYMVLGEVITVTCTFPASGTQTISLNYRSCF